MSAVEHNSDHCSTVTTSATVVRAASFLVEASRASRARARLVARIFTFWAK